MEHNPYPRDIEVAALNFQYQISEVIKLPPQTVLPTEPFAEIILNRKSERTFAQLSLEEIGSILWISVKVKEITVQTNGYILTHRPSASAGARHPIDTLVFYKTDSYKCYYYNPFEHSLNLLALDKSIDSLVSHINSIVNIQNGAIIWFIAHPSRTEAKYLNPASLIWRDAGALLHCVQIACTSLKTKSCPIGSLGEPYISDIFSNNGEILSAGGLIVGG
jgi:SagB-type dehydrogenase family enzyme